MQAEAGGIVARTRGSWRKLLDLAPLGLLVVFGSAAVAGYAVFGRDPSRLADASSWAVRFYGHSFRFFAQGHVLLAGLVLVVHLWRYAGGRWLAAFGLVYGLSLGAELLGTAYGVPFGPYRYTDLLGAKWLGLVPLLIPLSWFSMAIPSYALAGRALECGGPGWSVVVADRGGLSATAGVGPDAGPCDERGDAVLGVGRGRSVLRDAVDEPVRLVRDRRHPDGGAGAARGA